MAYDGFGALTYGESYHEMKLRETLTVDALQNVISARNEGKGSTTIAPRSYEAGASAYLELSRSDSGETHWFGSLVTEQADAAGLRYRRNRYYDPATGTFTQEDPIGLAGGLNLYGYANGDPVNFSDPFGLSPCKGAAAMATAAGAAVVDGPLPAGDAAAAACLVVAVAAKLGPELSRRAHALGKAGEDFVRRTLNLEKNTQQLLGRRIPDFADAARNVFHEVKNTAKVGLTRQIREMIDNLDEGQKLIIHVRESGTRVSKLLEPYIERGVVQIVREIPK